MRRPGTAVLVVMLIASCGGGAPPSSTALRSGSPASTAVSTPMPAITPGPIATPTSQPAAASPTPVATTPPPSTPAPPTTVPSLEPGRPPQATMTAAGSAGEVSGRLSSYTIGQFVSDGPWLPARILGRVTVHAGAKLSIRFPDGTSIADWSARYAAADDEEAVVKRALTDGRLLDGAVEAVAPPTGDWAVELDLDYPANQGSGSYFWRVTVTP